MYERIVAGTDGTNTSRGAVEHAVGLAALTGAEVHLVSAVRLPSQAAMLAPELMAAVAVSDRDAEAAAHELLDRLADELRHDGVKVQVHVCHSAPADALVTVAMAEKADLIVVGNKGMKGARRVLGSVPNSVAHHAPCAVLIVSTC